MKNAFIIFVLILGFTSCKKDNSLEDVSLYNPNDVDIVNYLEVVNVEQMGCSVIKFDLKVNNANIPKELVYTHFLIKDKYNNPRITTETKDIFMTIPCNEESRYELTLYNTATNRESLPSIYIYKP